MSPSKSDSSALTHVHNGVPEEAYHIFGVKRIAAAVGLCLVLFLAALDNAIVSVALPSIGQNLHDYQRTSWVVTAYFLTYTAFLPILSKMTDIVGRRPVLIASSLWFALWSGACGGAKTMIQLIVFRALQGIGASAIFSGVLLCMSTMVPRHEVPVFSSLIGLVFSISNTAGPILGGVIVQNAHWGWIFFINLPISVIGVALIWWSVHDPHAQKPTVSAVLKRVDWLGCLCILAFSLLLCTPLQLGGTQDHPWKSAPILVPMILSFFILPIFLWLQTKVTEPVIPLRLFKDLNTCIGILVTMCIGAGFFTLCIFLPQRMQIVNGKSPLNAGVRMLPLLALTGTSSALAGASVKWLKGYRLQIWFGMIIGSIGCGLISSLGVDSPFARQYGYQVLVGVSFGLCIVCSTVVIQLNSSRADLASAMGTQSFVRQIGGLISIAIGTALINSRVNSAIDHEGLPANILVSPEEVLKTVPPQVLAVARHAYSVGYSRAFIVAAVWFALGTVVSFALRHYMPEDFLVKKKPVDAEASTQESTKVDPQEKDLETVDETSRAAQA